MGTRTATNFALANSLSSTKFSSIVVEGEVGEIKNKKKFILLGFGAGNALVKLAVAGDL